MAEWLSLNEAADRLGMSRSALHRAFKAGNVRGKRTGRRLLISMDPADGMENGMVPGRDRDGAGARAKASERLAARREAMIEVELERARLELQDEQERRESARLERAKARARAGALNIARMLLRRCADQPRHVLEQVAEELDLFLNLAQPEDITPDAVARIFLRVLSESRSVQVNDQSELDEGPPNASRMVLTLLMARRLGLG